MENKLNPQHPQRCQWSPDLENRWTTTSCFKHLSRSCCAATIDNIFDNVSHPQRCQWSPDLDNRWTTTSSFKRLSRSCYAATIDNIFDNVSHPQRCQWSPDLDNRWTTTSLKRLSRSSTIDNVFVFLRLALCLLLMVGAAEVSGQTPCSNPPQCELIGNSFSGSLSQTSFAVGANVSFTVNVNSTFTAFSPSPLLLQDNGGCPAPNTGSAPTFRLQIDNINNNVDNWWGFFDILGDCSANMITNGLTGTMQYNQSFARTGGTTVRAINLGSSLPVGVYAVIVRLGSTTAHSQFAQIGTFTVGILPPSSFSTTPTSSTSISLAWTDNSTNETAFKVQRSLTSGTGFTTIATLAANTTTYTDNTVAAGTTYYYRILATNGGGDSAPSNEANAKTFDVGTTVAFSDPNLGGISNAVLYAGQIHYAVNHTPYELSLSGYPDIGSKGWTSQLRNESGTLITTYENAPLGADFAQSNDLQLTPTGNLAYAYRKWAGFSYAFDGFYKVWNGTTLSSENQFTTQNDGIYQRLRYGADNVPRITNFSAAGYRFIYFNKPVSTWQGFDLGSLGAAGASSYASVMQGNDIYTSFLAGTNIIIYNEISGTWSGGLVTTGTNNCDIRFSPTNNLQALFENNFQLRLGTNTGVWSFENVATTAERVNHRASLFYRTDNTPLVVYQTDNRLVVLEKQGAFWNEIYHHANLNYSVFVGNTRQPTLLYKGADLYVVYADAKNVYVKKVDALNPPSSLVATPNTLDISLNWADKSINETAFKVQRSLTSGTGFTTIATLAANTITYTDNTVAAGTTYYYRIIATNGAGDSAPSNEANATTFTTVVTNTNNSGFGSLRQAIINANLLTGADNITFNIPIAGVQTIQLLTPLPDITETVTINAYSQPLATPNTLSVGNNANILIEIDGTITAQGQCLKVANVPNCVIRGLAIKNFYGAGLCAITIAGTNAINTVVEGNFIGTDATGLTAANNQNGICVQLGANNNLIGGNIPASRNVISGNTDFGLIIVSANSDFNKVSNNYIGLNKFGTSVINNGTSLSLGSSAKNNTIGGTTVQERNIISGSTGSGGLQIQDAGTDNNSIIGNYIGTDANGNNAGTGNAFCGIYIFSGAKNNTIGGSPSNANVIAYNPIGIIVQDATSISNLISQNSIFANTNDGIALLSGGNNNKLAPTPTNMTATLVSGTCQIGDIVEIFLSNPIQGAAKQGKNYLGQATVVGTNWTFISTFSNSDAITATAKDASNNTSPFSTPISIVPILQATNITLTNISARSLVISWTNGDGANRVVKINTSNNFTNLVNATAYTANSNYSGIGEQVVYNSSGNTAFIGGLQPKTKYFFKAYEYNGTGVTASYLNTSAQGNPASFLTFATPPIPPTDLVFTDITTTTISGRFKPIVADGYLIVRRAKESSPQTPPNGYPLKIGDTFFNGQVVVGVGKLTTFKAEKLTSATDYTFDVYAYNGENESIAYSTKPLSGTARTHNPLPILETIAPTEALSGQGLITLSAFGKDFVKGATVLWEGIPLPTVFVSENELKAEIGGNYFLTARKYNISVSNPVLGGGKSKELPFEVKPSYLVESVKVGDKFVLPETQNHLLHRICIRVFGENNALKQIKFDLSGTFKPQDLERNAFTLWLSQDTLLDNKDVKLKDFPAASRLVFETTANTPLPIKVNEPFCLLLTANIAEKATAGHTIWVSPLTEKDISLSKEVSLLSGTIPYQIGGIQTIRRTYVGNPTDSLSLVRWCRAMKGETWERTWDFSQPVGKWHGIDLDQNGKVRSITLVNNNLQGNLSDEIFTDEDGAITSEMQYLNLSGNKITGEMPEKISKCKKMEYLDVSKNLMGGRLTEGIGEVRNLVTLWLSYNRFEEIPESIGNCQKLRNLHCNNKKISKLPENIGKLSSLEVARFEGNELKKLPVNFASLPNLQECYLQNNALHFEHLEPLADRPSKLKTFVYAPQAKIGEAKEIFVEEGKTFEIQIDTKGKSNQYTWYKDEKPHQTTQEPSYKDVVNYSKTGIYKLIVKNEKCKDLTLESHEYKVKMYCNSNLYQIKAVAENNDVFCPDDKIEAILSTQLPANVENKEKASFQWLKGGTPIHQAENQKFVAQEVGSYAVRVILPSGCTYISETVSISKAERVAVRLQREGDVLMAITKQDITNYEWFLNNRLLERSITSSLNMVESGRYRVRITDKNGCQTTSAEENMNVTALEEIKIANLSIEIFPNPSSAVFKLKMNKPILKSIWIIDALGRDAHQESFISPVQEYFFNLENKAVGIYWVRMQTTEGYAQVRIVKE